MSRGRDHVYETRSGAVHTTVTVPLLRGDQPRSKKEMSSRIEDSDWKCWDIWSWTGEVVIRIALFIIFLLSAKHIPPYFRYVEIHEWHLYNFPHADPETIEPEWVYIAICVGPLLLVSLCSAIRPGWRKRYHYDGDKKKQTARIQRRVLSEYLIAALACSLAYLANGAITDVIKNAYGRPRPDFLSRCFTPTAMNDQPEDTFVKANADNLWLTLPSRRYPQANTPAQIEALNRFGVNGTETGEIPFPYIEDVKSMVNVEDCINSDGGVKLLMTGGRRSFPSGHTSFAFAGATFCALYSYYWLGKMRSKMNLGRTIPFPGTSVKLGMIFLWFIPAIYVAITRTQDYRHHPGDVFCGALIGVVTTFLTFVQYYDLRTDSMKTAVSSPEPSVQSTSLSAENHL